MSVENKELMVCFVSVAGLNCIYIISCGNHTVWVCPNVERLRTKGISCWLESPTPY